MLSKFVPAILALTIAAPAHAAFVPEPTAPPVITNSSGTRMALNYASDANLPYRYPTGAMTPTQARAIEANGATPPLTPAQLRCVIRVGSLWRSTPKNTDAEKAVAAIVWKKGVRACLGGAR